MLSVLVTSRTTLFCFVFYSFFVIDLACGQFTTVINVPPDTAPSSIESDTQLNLFEEGVIGSFCFSLGHRSAQAGVSRSISPAARSVCATSTRWFSVTR